jgi:regulator of sirC expression with transglutaminase-like and TPR domain
MASAAVQAVLQEALRAQEFEDEGDISSALECYYRATSQLSYFVDTCRPDTGTALAGLCDGLGQQYEQRMAVSTCAAV